MEQRDSQLSQAYRDAQHPEPSPDLDARVLDAARQAVAKPATRRRPSWFAWAVPFSTVAVLVLGITLLFEIQRQAPEVIESPTAIPPAVRLDQGEAPRMPEVKPADADTMPRQTESTEPAPPAHPTPRVRSKALPKANGATVSATADRGTAEMEAAAPHPFPAQSAATPASPPPPPAAAKAEARPAPKPAPAVLQEMARSAGATGSVADQSMNTMSTPPQSAAMPPARAGAPALGGTLEKRKAAEPVVKGPEQMVETIRRLVREGRLDEAQKELDKLRRIYPGFEVPEDLKGL